MSSGLRTLVQFQRCERPLVKLAAGYRLICIDAAFCFLEASEQMCSVSSAASVLFEVGSSAVSCRRGHGEEPAQVSVGDSWRLG